MQIAESSEEILGAVSLDHLAEDEDEHPDREDELQKEESDLFRTRAHVPPAVTGAR